MSIDWIHFRYAEHSLNIMSSEYLCIAKWGRISTRLCHHRVSYVHFNKLLEANFTRMVLLWCCVMAELVTLINIYTSVEDDLHWTYFVTKSNTPPQAYLYWSILILSQCNARNANISCQQFEICLYSQILTVSWLWWNWMSTREWCLWIGVEWINSRNLQLCL